MYDKFWLPKGGKLFIYSKDGKQSIGAFTSKNNKGKRKNIKGFATGLIYSDDIIVEYYQPAQVKEKAIISISYVVYGYKHINLQRGNKDFGHSDYCNININCEEGQNWQKEKEAVALILINGYRSSTGFLINTTRQDLKPFLLTGDHCLMDEHNYKYDALMDSLLPNFSFYWHYEHPGCENSSVEPPQYSTVGAKVIANNSVSDFALLELTEDPKDLNTFTPYYLGWDRIRKPVGEVVGIHHPYGDVKKISITNNFIEETSYMSNWGGKNFWKVVWDNKGATEPGSSGSPLLNSAKRVVGQLTGGKSGCNSEDLRDWYGCFHTSWIGSDNEPRIQRRLDHWLDPDNTGVSMLDGVSAGLHISGSNEMCYEGTYTVENLPLGATVEWEWTTFDPRMYLYSGQNTPTVTFRYLGVSYENPPPLLDLFNYMTITAKVSLNSEIIELEKVVYFNLKPYFRTVGSCETWDVTTFIAKSYDEAGYPYSNFSWTVEPPAETGEPITTETGKVLEYEVIEPGDYKITLSADGLCGRVKYSKVVTFTEYQSSNFSLSPNPATDVVTLSFEQENNGFRTFSTAKTTKDKYKIQLWNSLGLVKEVVTDQKEYRLSLHGIPAGFYYVHIIKGKQVIRKQLVIK